MNPRSGLAILVFPALLTLAGTLSAQTLPFTVPAGIGLCVEFKTNLGTAISHGGDEVEVRLVEPVVIGGRQVLPQGTLFSGRVLAVRGADWSGGTLPALRPLFTKIVLPDGRTLTARASLAFLEHQKTLKVDAQGAAVPMEPEAIAPKAYTSPTYSSSASVAENMTAALIMGIIRGAVRSRQYRDFKLKEGLKAWLVLDSDLVLPSEERSIGPKTLVAPAAGTVTGNSYRNEFFGFSYSYPQGWHVESEEAQKEVALRGHEMVFGENADQQSGEHSAEHRAAMQRTSFLLRATQNAGSEMRLSSVQIVAFDLSSVPTLPEPRTMLAMLGESVTSKGGEVLEPATERSVAGRQFAVARYKLNVEGPDEKTTAGFQASALTYDRGYALIWFFTASNQKDVDELVETLKSLIFGGNAAPAGPDALPARGTDRTLPGGLYGGFQDEGTFAVYKEEGTELGEDWATLKSPNKWPHYTDKYTRLAATTNYKWQQDGSYVSECLRGNNPSIATKILVDETGEWASITVSGIRQVQTLKNLFPGEEQLELVRNGNEVRRTSIHGGKTLETKPFTVPAGAFLFNLVGDRNDYDPALLTPILRRYDRAKGGEQMFPVFEFLSQVEGLSPPSDVVLEMTGVTERRVGDQDLHLTSFYYRYEVKQAGADNTWFVTHLHLLADDEGRIYLGGLPRFSSQDTADKIFARKGYEVLRDDPSLVSIVTRTSSSIHYPHN